MHAINLFVETNGVLPLPGAVPDMKAQSKDYIALQTLYKAKAQSDLASVSLSVRTLESKLGREKPVEPKEIEAFCKGAAFVKLIRGRKITLHHENQPIGDDLAWLTDGMIGDPSMLAVVVALRAMESSILPTRGNMRTEKDLESFNSGGILGAMQAHVQDSFSLLEKTMPEDQLEGPRNRAMDIVAEIQRSGPVELHNISSLMGGIVAQEIIKVITKQYVPVDNTCIFDGIQSKTAVYRL